MRALVRQQTATAASDVFYSIEPIVRIAFGVRDKQMGRGPFSIRPRAGRAMKRDVACVVASPRRSLAWPAPVLSIPRYIRYNGAIGKLASFKAIVRALSGAGAGIWSQAGLR
jgi:hypothetical protein